MRGGQALRLLVPPCREVAEPEEPEGAEGPELASSTYQTCAHSCCPGRGLALARGLGLGLLQELGLSSRLDSEPVSEERRYIRVGKRHNRWDRDPFTPVQDNTRACVQSS